MLHVMGWGWLEAADGKNLSQTRPAKSESEAYCKSESASAFLYYLCATQMTQMTYTAEKIINVIWLRLSPFHVNMSPKQRLGSIEMNWLMCVNLCDKYRVSICNKHLLKIRRCLHNLYYYFDCVPFLLPWISLVDTQSKQRKICQHLQIWASVYYKW